jgi:hypothetical protein
MTLLQPVGNERRDQSWPAKGRSEGFAGLNGDFFNAIDPNRTSEPSQESQRIPTHFESAAFRKFER